MKRKILTLEEVLNLDRCPTLQEMVDLTIEDYAMYLYKKGIIEREPVEDDFELYESENVDDPFIVYSGYTYFTYEDNKYTTLKDELPNINHPTYEPSFDRDKYKYMSEEDKTNEYYMSLWDVPNNFNLQESKEWNNPNIIEKGTIYFRHGCDIEYSIDNNFILTLYEKNTEGKYWNPAICNDNKLYYLEKYNDNIKRSNKITKK